jgi:hypothetical protein
MTPKRRTHRIRIEVQVSGDRLLHDLLMLLREKLMSLPDEDIHWPSPEQMRLLSSGGLTEATRTMHVHWSETSVKMDGPYTKKSDLSMTANDILHRPIKRCLPGDTEVARPQSPLSVPEI